MAGALILAVVLQMPKRIRILMNINPMSIIEHYWNKPMVMGVLICIFASK
jgi:hypothetical protein